MAESYLEMQFCENPLIESATLELRLEQARRLYSAVAWTVIVLGLGLMGSAFLIGRFSFLLPLIPVAAAIMIVPGLALYSQTVKARVDSLEANWRELQIQIVLQNRPASHAVVATETMSLV